MSWFTISWQSIIAGSITALAISIVMAVLGVALGFTVVSPTTSHPMSGLGTAFGVWGVISILLSLAAGGFAAGLFSITKGAEHGFMVWAVVLIVGALFSGAAVGSAVRTVGAVVRGVGSGAASVASTVGSAVGGSVSDMASSAYDRIANMHLDIDTDHLGDQVNAVLRDTGVEELQPDYLRHQVSEVRADLRNAFHQVTEEPDSFDNVVAQFMDRQRARFNDLTENVDKNAAVNALMQNRNISREEAEEEVNAAILAFNRTVDRAKRGLDRVQEQVQEARVSIQQAADRARVKADRFASTAAKSALAAGVALILGAVVCVFAGHWGNRYSTNYIVVQETSGITASRLDPRFTDRTDIRTDIRNPNTPNP